MYSASQFDGNAAFSGGGFMPSQATQATATDSPFSAKNRDSHALRPLTVKQISDAMLSSDDKSNFIVDGVDVNNLTLVGMVFNISGRVTVVSFVLDDGTGRIDCIRWVNDPVDTKETDGIMDGMYVRVHGHLKGFQGKRTLSTFSIKPLIDFNEISYHFIQCMYVHMYNTKSRKVQGLGAPSQITVPAASTPFKGHEAIQSNQYAGLRGVDSLVLKHLQLPECLASDKGVHLDVLVKSLNTPLDKIMQSIKSLEEDGLVYSTIDDFHYKSTGNG